MITNVIKQETGWWRGDYGGKLQHWFPVNYVEELVEDTRIKKINSGVSYNMFFDKIAYM